MHITATPELGYFEQQEVRDVLIRDGRLAAVKHVRDRLNVRLGEAIQLVNRLHVPRDADAPLAVSGDASWWSGYRPLVVVAALFLIVSAGFLTASVLVWRSHQDLIARSRKTEARVIRLHGSGRGRAPEFAYEWKGQPHTWRSSISSSPAAYDVGDTVEIYVDPTAPESILVDDFRHQWLLVLIFGFLGGAFSLATIIAGGLIRMTL